MHLLRFVQNVVRILDSQPSQIKPHTRGQSLVELAITAPLLFMMVVSMAEIGFAANNYLILLDAVRIGARWAVSADPIAWNDEDTRNYLRTACFNQTAWDLPNKQQSWRLTGWYDVTFNENPHNTKPFPIQGSPPQTALGYKLPTDPKLIPAPNAPKGLFDGVTCNTIAAMEPLYFDINYYTPGENQPGPNFNTNANYDDIAVSVVSYVASSGDVSITGRWPVSNRLCATGGLTDDGRDPFSYKSNSAPHASYPTGQVRGFILTGNMLASDSSGKVDPGCYGSSFTVGGKDPKRDLVAILNSNTLTDQLVQQNMVNGAMVIVEATWTHHQLFGFPPLSFLGNPTLYVWSVFPVTAAQPTPTPAPAQPPGPYSLGPSFRRG